MKLIDRTLFLPNDDFIPDDEIKGLNKFCKRVTIGRKDVFVDEMLSLEPCPDTISSMKFAIEETKAQLDDALEQIEKWEQTHTQEQV